MGQGVLYVVSPYCFVKSKPWSDIFDGKVFDTWLVVITLASDASHSADQKLEQALENFLAAPCLQLAQHRSNG